MGIVITFFAGLTCGFALGFIVAFVHFIEDPQKPRDKD